MRLVDEIIELLSSADPSLENALFKAQVLAHKFGEPELKSWVEHELKGYPRAAALPPYRIIPAVVMGTFSNGVYRYSDKPLPTMHLEDWIKERLCVKKLTQSIAVIEKWGKSDESLSLVVAPELYPALQKGLDRDFVLEHAHGRTPMGAMLQVTVEVRSRLLELALQLSDRIPNDLDTEQMKDISKVAQVGELFRNAVFGDNTTILVGSGSIQGTTNSIVKSDFATLSAALRAQEIPEQEIENLRVAVQEDTGAADHVQQKLGPRVRTWIGKLTKKVAGVTEGVSVGAAGELLSAAIKAYYGFGA